MKPLTRQIYPEEADQPWNAAGLRAERVQSLTGFQRLEWRNAAELLVLVPDVTISVAELWMRFGTQRQTPILHLPPEHIQRPVGRTLQAQLSGSYTLKSYGPAHLDPEIAQLRPVLHRLIETRWWPRWFTSDEPTSLPDKQTTEVLRELLSEAARVIGRENSLSAYTPTFMMKMAQEIRWVILMMSRAQSHAERWLATRLKLQPNLGGLAAKVNWPGMNFARYQVRPGDHPDNLTFAAITEGTAHALFYSPEPTHQPVITAQGKLQRHEVARLRLAVLHEAIDAAGSVEQLMEWSAEPERSQLITGALPFHSVVAYHPRLRQATLIAAESLLPTAGQLPLWLNWLGGLPRDEHDLHASDAHDPSPLVALQILNSHIKSLRDDDPQRRELYQLKNDAMLHLHRHGVMHRADNDTSRNEFEGVMVGLSEFGPHSFHIAPDAVLGLPRTEQGQEIMQAVQQHMKMRDRPEWIRSLISHVPASAAIAALRTMTS